MIKTLITIAILAGLVHAETMREESYKSENKIVCETLYKTAMPIGKGELLYRSDITTKLKYTSKALFAITLIKPSREWAFICISEVLNYKLKLQYFGTFDLKSKKNIQIYDMNKLGKYFRR